MYLACNDEEISRTQKLVFDSNKKLIDEYCDLPFYKRIFAHNPKYAIWERWQVFYKWMNKRIVEKSKDNVCQS